jgi:hypothetical protein
MNLFLVRVKLFHTMSGYILASTSVVPQKGMGILHGCRFFSSLAPFSSVTLSSFSTIAAMVS